MLGFPPTVATNNSNNPTGEDTAVRSQLNHPLHKNDNDKEPEKDNDMNHAEETHDDPLRIMETYTIPPTKTTTTTTTTTRTAAIASNEKQAAHENHHKNNNDNNNNSPSTTSNSYNPRYNFDAIELAVAELKQVKDILR